MIVRGKAQYLDPQLLKGTLRFAQIRGSNFSGLQPANKFPLTVTAPQGSTTLTLSQLPQWFQIGFLIRIGTSETSGELQLIQDIIQPTSLDTYMPLAETYDITADLTPQCSLLGTTATFFQVSPTYLARKILYIESWYPMVPGDSILASPDPTVLESLIEYPLSVVNLVSTRVGINPEPEVVYQYECEVGNASTLISFVPTVGLGCYLKAQPMFQRMDYGSGDILLDPTLGPCLVDAFYGGLIANQETQTVLGIKTWDVFGNQLNANNQQWQKVPSNYLIMQRDISSETFLLWERIQGQFQLLKTGPVFQAQLDSNGQFVMSSDLLVPPWDSSVQNSWVVPILAEGDITLTVQFMPQALQIVNIPHSVSTLIRPQIVADPNQVPINRIVICIQGSPNSTVQMGTWSYNGSIVNSVSYYILGTGGTFGLDRWLAGGFCVKPIFLNLEVLKAYYSDGVSAYDSGYIYS